MDAVSNVPVTGMLASAPGSAASMDGAGGAKLWGYVFEIDGR